MRAIAGLVLIIFGGNIMRIDCQEENMIDVTLEYVEIKEFKDNRYIERTGDNSIAWKEDAGRDIYAFLGIEELQELEELGFVCQEGENFPRASEYRDKFVTFFVAQGKPCPITKGTTSNLENQSITVQRKQRKSTCGSHNAELLLFDYSSNSDLMMSITVKLTNSGCQ